MMINLFAFIAGIIVVITGTTLLSEYFLSLLLLLVFYRQWHKLKYFTLTSCLFALMLGFCWALFYAHYIKPKSVDLKLHNKISVLQGKIVGLIKVSQIQRGMQKIVKIGFLFKPIKVSRDSQKVASSFAPSGLIKVSWYIKQGYIKQGFIKKEYIKKSTKKSTQNQSLKHPVLATGEVWRFKLKLKRINSVMSPGSFDLETWAFQQGISAAASIIPSNLNSRIKYASSLLSWDQLREMISIKLVSAISHKSSLALVSALVIGDRRYMSKADWQLLQDTGTAHLVAISGLHISLIAGLGYLIASWLWSRSYILTNWLAAPKFGCVFAFIFAYIYSGLAGFSLPTVRALLMLSVFLLFTLQSRPMSGYHRLLAAIVVVIIFDPFVLLSVSLYLSFAAVACLLMINKMRAFNVAWKNYLQWQLYIIIFLMPLSLFFFSSYSLIAPVANLISIPIFSFILVPLCLLATLFLFIAPPVALFLFSLIEQLSRFYFLVLQSLERFNFTGFNVAINNPWLLVLVCMAVLILLYAPLRRLKVVACFLIVPIFFVFNNEIKAGQFKLTVFDVGQGLAIFIQTRRHKLLYDTGPGYPSGFNRGDSVILPYFNYYQIKNIDQIIVSHFDMDHSGGLNALLTTEALNVGSVISSEKPTYFKHKLKLCTRGQVWYWDKVRFEILHPKFHWLEKNRNNRSCMLKISVGKFAVIIPGDVDKNVERRLVYANIDSSHLQASVLIVPHHGSLNSSSFEFLVAVNPKLALCSMGFKNRYGFPRPKLMERYKKQGINFMTTVDEGTMEFIFDENEGVTHHQSWRPKFRRFWHR